MLRTGSLFETQKELFDQIVGAAREAFARRDFPATAVWIETPEARPPGTVHVGVLGAPNVVDEAATEVRTHFQEVGRELATHFVVHSCTDADLVALGDDEEGQRAGRIGCGSPCPSSRS